MPDPSHSIFSTIWKPGSELSKPIQMNSDTMKVAAVVHSAIRRMLRRALSLSSRIGRINSTPTSGRKVTSERMCHSVMVSKLAPEHHPGDEGRDPDQHGKGVVVEVAGLQPHDAVGDVDDARRDAVRAQP